MESEIRKTKEETIGKFVADHLAKVEPTLSEKGLVLTILEGEARQELPLVAPNKVHLGGTISAPSEFYKHRKGEHNPLKCHVLFNLLAGTITLVCDENYENDNYKVVGKIEKNAELSKFRINSPESIDPSEMMKLLKFNRIYFPDKAENAKIVTALSTFKAKVTQEFEKLDDQRGMAKSALESKIEHDLQESFYLEIPIFKGQPKTRFKVMVCLEVRNGGVKVYLESVELMDLENAKREEIIREELKNFEGIVCIEQ